MKKLLSSIFCLLVFGTQIFAAEDAYDKMAREFSEASTSLKEGKIAIVPFAYTDGRKSEGGIVISERLTTRIVKLKKLKVIERQLLEKVLQELHLESSGLVEIEGVKQIGRVLGVEAIITGTLMDIGYNRTEINARMINTETAEIITTSSIEVEKVWDGVADKIVQPRYEQKQEISEQNKEVPQSNKANTDGFIDLMFGNSKGTMDLVFQNNTRLVSEHDLYFNLDNNPSTNLAYKKISFNNLEVETVGGPVGLRFCGFPEKKHLGIGLEFFYIANNLVPQKTKEFYINDIKQSEFNFNIKNYLEVKSFLMSVDLFLRLSSKIFQPYIGCGIGVSMNIIASPYIYEYTTTTTSSQGLNMLGIGFEFRVPYGIRIKLGKKSKAALFIERRNVSSVSWFDRGRTTDNDSVALKLTHTLIGLNLNF